MVGQSPVQPRITAFSEPGHCRGDESGLNSAGPLRMEDLPQTKRTGSPSQELWKGFFIGTIKSEANDTEHQPLYGQKYLA